MKRIGLIAIAGAILLALVSTAPAQQTLLGVCTGTIDVTATAAGVENVYCTPTVTPPPTPPTDTIAANPSVINPGGSSVLTWNSLNATACLASGAWSGSEGLSGTLSVSPTVTSTYTLICNGAGGSATAAVSVTVAQNTASNCGLQLGGPVIFCDPFDTPNTGIPSRTGALDPNVWGVSRASGNVNLGGQYNTFPATHLVGCTSTTVVTPPNDVIICNGQLREALNDNLSGVLDAGTVAVLAMYPKQPFDFAGRTGTVAFDVSNDSTGTHSAWPEFWLTDLPDPAPFKHFASWLAYTPNSLGIRFGGGAGPGNGGGNCQTSADFNVQHWTVDSAVVIRNNIPEDSDGNGPTFGSHTGLTVTQTDCVIAPSGPNGGLNHVELRISQNEIDVYASDAGTTALRKIATITNANLTFSRGLVWIEDVHYNADKGDPTQPSQREHTFTWDNVAFDGPFVYRDFSFDALDNTLAGANGSVNLGQKSNANAVTTWNVLNMPSTPQGTAARVLFNFNNELSPIPTTIQVNVNGHAHPVAWPYPDATTFSWRTLAVTIPLTDLVAGTNVVTIGSDQPQITSNVNIVLVNVPGGVPVLPGSINTYPNSTNPAPTVTLSAAPTSIVSGLSSTLTWSTTNAAACMASGGWTGSKAISGTQSVSPVVNTTYTLTCTGLGGSAVASATVTVTTSASGCQFLSGTATAAFCESVASANAGGRAGDLDDSKWSVSRTLQDGLDSKNLIAFPPVPVSACKAGVTSAVPDSDIMVCDSASGHLGQFETAMMAQNYAMISMRPRQKFDFTGRTGIITFNVDAITQGEGSWWQAVYVTDQPVSAAINSASVQGMLPVNGVGLNFNDNCAVQNASLTKVDGVFVFTNSVESFVSFSDAVCFTTSRGHLNHIEIKLSTSAVEVWASDFSLDNVTFPNFRKVGSAAITVPFSAGYVHFNQKQRAPIKNEAGFYTPGYANNYWSNLGFDGSTTANEVGYQVADALTIDTSSTTNTDFVGLAGAVNVGYGLLTSPYGMYSCCASGGAQIPISTLSIPGVSLTGVTSAQLTFTVTYTYVAALTPSTVNLRYSLNGGALTSPATQPNYAAQVLCTGCPGSPNGGSGVTYSFAVPLSSLVAGNNTITFAVDNSWNAFPPVIANIELLTFH